MTVTDPSAAAVKFEQVKTLTSFWPGLNSPLEAGMVHVAAVLFPTLVRRERSGGLEMASAVVEFWSMNVA